MKYDDISWHYNNDFPKDLKRENAGTHIGMFIGWLIKKDLISEWLKQIGGEDIAKVQENKISGRDFLFKNMDGKLTSEDLSDIGNKFAMEYYDSDLYFDDYANILGKDLPSLFHIANTNENVQKIEKQINKRFKSYLLKHIKEIK